MEQLYKIEHANRTYFNISTFSYNETWFDWFDVTQSTYYTWKLFYLQSGHRFILFVLPTLVRDSNSFQFLNIIANDDCSLPGYRSVGKRHWAMQWHSFWNVCQRLQYVIQFFQPVALHLDHICWL